MAIALEAATRLKLWANTRACFFPSVLAAGDSRVPF